MMTLSEKVNQIGDTANGVPRIGLPQYEWWSEALHGVSDVGKWNRKASRYCDETLTLVFDDGSEVGKSPRNARQRPLSRWRVSVYAVNYVRGLQDVEGTENVTDLNSRPLKVAACCKHYAAYDVDNWLGIERYNFDARVTEQDMLETFLKPFEMYIVSDCDSIEVMINHQKWLKDEPEDAVAQALKAGLDLDCGHYYTNYVRNSVRKGKVSEKDIDAALKNLYIVLMRLGFFDGSPQLEKLDITNVCSDEHIELATEAAREGVVLLKNDNLALPLSTDKIKTIAVVGPHANSTSAMIGNYAGKPD
ncbi:beta-xylosidase/alpha-L-arabinofuranosidase 1-like [Dorcoceras hygrometricum]|uniref:Beta-xylosidase/alpha-L-arabinofuranosidase 1-like n=1 Tax=Dorcoceras hygrometricum TaxID=472368 RepID=A0A2Z7DE31_9LAMI|nr:beta-xylosidase/alpha-L-arabinofuranosidase 1-like [Dorcoceras hygrometricum]